MVFNEKRKPVFIKQKWNHVIFFRATILSFNPVLFYIYICVKISPYFYCFHRGFFCHNRKENFHRFLFDFLFFLSFLGTQFMVKLQTQLQYFVVQKISTDPLWQGVDVYLSGHEVRCTFHDYFVDIYA